MFAKSKLELEAELDSAIAFQNNYYILKRLASQPSPESLQKIFLYVKETKDIGVALSLISSLDDFERDIAMLIAMTKIDWDLHDNQRSIVMAVARRYPPIDFCRRSYLDKNYLMGVIFDYVDYFSAEELKALFEWALDTSSESNFKNTILAALFGALKGLAPIKKSSVLQALGPSPLHRIFRMMKGGVFVDALNSEVFDLDLKDSEGKTILTLVCEAGNTAAARAILQKGHTGFRQDFSEGAPLRIALNIKNQSLMELFTASMTVVAMKSFKDSGLGKAYIDFACAANNAALMQNLQVPPLYVAHTVLSAKDVARMCSLTKAMSENERRSFNASEIGHRYFEFALEKSNMELLQNLDPLHAKKRMDIYKKIQAGLVIDTARDSDRKDVREGASNRRAGYSSVAMRAMEVYARAWLYPMFGLDAQFSSSGKGSVNVIDKMPENNASPVVALAQLLESFPPIQLPASTAGVQDALVAGILNTDVEQLDVQHLRYLMDGALTAKSRVGFDALLPKGLMRFMQLSDMNAEDCKRFLGFLEFYKGKNAVKEVDFPLAEVATAAAKSLASFCLKNRDAHGKKDFRVLVLCEIARVLEGQDAVKCRWLSEGNAFTLDLKEKHLTMKLAEGGALWKILFNQPAEEPTIQFVASSGSGAAETASKSYRKEHKRQCQ